MRDLRLTLPVLAAVVVSAAAMVAIVELVLRADASREAQVKLDDVETDINQLQSLPSQLASSSSQTSTQVANAAAALESSMRSRLSALERDASVPQLRQLDGLLHTNFALLGAELASLGRHQVKQARTIAGRRFHSQDLIDAALDGADHAYQTKAVESEIEAVGGSGTIVLLLLAGFALFFARAFLAREAAERLAGELSESREHLEEAQHLAAIGSWEWDFDSRTYFCSPEQLRLHGWGDTQELTNVKALLSAIDIADRERIHAELVRRPTPGETLSLDYQVPLPEGRRLIHLEARPVASEHGSPRGLIGTCQDVSERFRRLEAERASRTKSEFMSRMSHELRTPLNAILGFGQLLKADAMDERRARNVDRILGAGEHLLALINELIEISRIDTDRLELATEATRLDGLLCEAIDQVRSEAESRAIEICSDLGIADVWADVDREQLRQVLVRLLSNAVRCSHDGARVEVRLAADGERASIVIAEDEPVARGQTIEAFERPGAEQTEVRDLGLTLSKGVVEAIGGSIELQTDDRRASVRLELPRLEPPSPEPAPAGTESGVIPRQVVLCIDDNTSNLTLIEQILSMRPAIELLTAERGRHGLELARDRRPRLILLDLHLPDIDGSEVLARLKADPVLREIPVVVLSADATPGQQERLTAGGASGYLTKPIDIEELLTLIDRILAAEPTEPL
jgi:signal transduction histidine kinase/CheY-like chemotaxis protein